MHVAWAPLRAVYGRRVCSWGPFWAVPGSFWELLGIGQTCHFVQYILKKSGFPGASQVRRLSVGGPTLLGVALSASCVHLARVLAGLGCAYRGHKRQRPPLFACILLSARASCSKIRVPSIFCVRFACCTCILRQRLLCSGARTGLARWE